MTRLRLALLVPLVCLAQTLVFAQYSAYNYGFDVKTRVKRQLARRSELVVRDKTATVGDVVVRQEIRQLEKDADLWTLYILALSMLQFTDQTSPTSYYGLAGLCLVAICASWHRA
jgi:tyrosinase